MSNGIESQEFDVVLYYNRLLEQDVGTTKTIATVNTLLALLEASPVATSSETLALVQRGSDRLVGSLSNAFAVTVGIDLFRHHILCALRDDSTAPSNSSADRGAPAQAQDAPSQDFMQLRTQLLTSGKALANNALKDRERTGAIAARLINADVQTIITCGDSQCVASTIQIAVQAGKKLRVLLCTGNDQVNAVSKVWSKSEIVPESIIFERLANSNIMVASTSMFVIGAECLLKNGGAISARGTRLFAMMCRSEKIPLHVIAESYKFSRHFPLPSDTILGVSGRITKTHPNTREGPVAGNPVNGAESEYIAPTYFDRIVTERGVITPSGVSEALLVQYS